MTELPTVVRFDAGGVFKSNNQENTQMDSFTLSRDAIRAATSWGYHRCHTLIEQPYQLESRLDPSGYKGGGRTQRFRLSDLLSRLKPHKRFKPEMEQILIAADAAYRKEYMK